MTATMGKIKINQVNFEQGTSAKADPFSHFKYNQYVYLPIFLNEHTILFLMLNSDAPEIISFSVKGS